MEATKDLKLLSFTSSIIAAREASEQEHTFMQELLDVEQKMDRSVSGAENSFYRWSQSAKWNQNIRKRGRKNKRMQKFNYPAIE